MLLAVDRLAIDFVVALPDLLILGKAITPAILERRRQLQLVGERARTFDHAPGEELGAAARSVAEQADALALELGRLALEQRRQRQVQRAGVDVADLRRQTQRR